MYENELFMTLIYFAIIFAESMTMRIMYEQYGPLSEWAYN